MPYATQQDILDREGEDQLYAVADRDRDGTLDTAAIERALTDASNEMDGYIGQRWDLPLPTVPAWSMQVCIDIALYRLARSSDALTRELRTRYEDAVSHLGRVAQGKVGLGVATAQEPDTGTSGEVKGGEILETVQPRRFGRNRRGLL